MPSKKVPNKSVYRSLLKPIFDFVFSIITLILFAPVIIIIICMYLIFRFRPIFFVQERAGRDELPFKIFKFRTLKPSSNDTQASRSFGMGTFLRKYSLDELPQLWNVLKGEMSIIGPRPLLMDYLDKYSAEQKARHKVKPGITGLAQVNGRNNLDWGKRFEYDLYYVENLSLLLDIKILLKTMFNYFSSKDVVPDFNDPFQGSS